MQFKTISVESMQKSVYEYHFIHNLLCRLVLSLYNFSSKHNQESNKNIPIYDIFTGDRQTSYGYCQYLQNTFNKCRTGI